MSIEELRKKVIAAVPAELSPNGPTLQINTAQEAKLFKARLTQSQKELRLIKKEIGIALRSINAAYTTERTKVGKGIGAGFAAGLFGRKTVGRVNASTRDAIRRNQINARAPYETLSQQIDTTLLNIDKIKISVDEFIAKNS